MEGNVASTGDVGGSLVSLRKGQIHFAIMKRFKKVLEDVAMASEECGRIAINLERIGQSMNGATVAGKLRWCPISSSLI
jgi:hypothetical protein